VFIGKHWSELNKRYGPLFTLEEAAEDFTVSSQKTGLQAAARILWTRLKDALRLLLRR
jgi:hypothetical protein